uniref:Uncharacterized protein n=1 Tax=Eutreptiella gymnastica TaxID=73025 RepID=A0A7S4LAA5_9EUGL
MQKGYILKPSTLSLGGARAHLKATKSSCILQIGWNFFRVQLLRQFSTLHSSNIKKIQNPFVDIVTSHNDQTCYVKHVLCPLHEFLTLFGDWVLGGPGTGAQTA